MDSPEEKFVDGYPPSQIASALDSLEQRLTTISDTNRHILLNTSQTRHSVDSRIIANIILRRLEVLNPEVARHFYTKRDVVSDLELRMIRSTTSKLLNDIPSFIAVSYCWHYSNWPLAPSATPIVPGWEISRPMMDAVLGARNHPDEGVWLDKLCIDQEDEADKTTHIASMDTIYRSARRMVILLEDVQLTKEEEEAALAYRAFYADMSKKVEHMGLDEKRKVMKGYFPEREKAYIASGRGSVISEAKSFAMKLLTARWFSRAWCAHESRMHPHRRIDNPLVFCFGSSGVVLSFEFRFIYYLAQYLSENEPGPSNGTLVTAMNDPNPTTITQLYWRLIRLMPGANNNDSLLQHMVHVFSFGCLKKGDLICIALNTAGIPLSYDGHDVGSTEEMIWMASLLGLAAGDLIPLVMTGSKLTLSESNKSFTSWAIHPTQGMVDETVPNPLPNSITAVTREYIELDLMVFTAQPQKPSQVALETAMALIKEHDLVSVARDLLAAADDSVQSVVRLVLGETAALGAAMSVSRTNTDKFLETTLALAIDAGLDWTLALPLVMAQSTREYQHGVIDGTTSLSIEDHLKAAARSILRHFNISSPTEQQLKNMISFLAILLDPRLPMLTTGPRRLPLPSFLGGAAFTPSISNRSYIAIPVVLAHIPALHERAWIIEPFDPTAPPEDPESHFPGPEYTDALRRKAMDVELEDVVPVLDTDYDDRRQPMPRVEKAAWRLRRKNVLFGCPEWDGQEILGRRRAGADENGFLVSKKQRVYGSEDYRWGDIWKAVKMRELDAEREGEMTG
ncbi:heterokaryon incompatibility protein-domain-containing protein [Triangularia verruculosa]|uniref:Heterokaryon incompatibility protein-domain-containing protein n=1 Tax=Triangularia verruculosa TaxID=2587418 RepID=A0AAN7AY01_9PEZI|nr:heterokaryon incompatibility protein-domain-containing protein [Triangularia verruculosa]